MDDPRPTAELAPGAGWARAGAIWVVAVLVLASMLASANVIVDPRAEFGSDALLPLVTDDVTIKLQLAQQRPEPWEVLVLGSSRAIAIDPEILANGSSASFNWAISSGRPPDMELLYRFVLNERGAPDDVYLGIEPEWLLGHGESGLTNSPAQAIIEHGRDPRQWDVGSAASSLTPSYLKDTGQSLRFAFITGYPETQFEYSESGERWPAFWHRDPVPRDEREAMIQDWAGRNLVPIYAGTARVDQERMQALINLITEVSKHSTRVTVFLPPIAPAGVELVADFAAFRGVRETIADVVADLCRPDLNFVDLTDVASFSGDPLGFYDGWHYVEENPNQVSRALPSAPECVPQVDEGKSAAIATARKHSF